MNSTRLEAAPIRPIYLVVAAGASVEGHGTAASSVMHLRLSWFLPLRPLHIIQPLAMHSLPNEPVFVPLVFRVIVWVFSTLPCQLIVILAVWLRGLLNFYPKYFDLLAEHRPSPSKGLLPLTRLCAVEI